MSSRFPLPLNVQFLNTEKSWKLLQPFTFIDPDLWQIDVPARFVTNGLTLPRIPIIRALFDDYGFPAAVVHDFLYAKSGISRKDADKVFYNALRECGVAKWRAALMYAGVRTFGFLFYKAK